MPKLDLERIESTNATGYPPPYAAAVAGRFYRRLGKAAGLEDFGVSHVVLEPGAWASQRHWHEGEDEFLVVIAGEAVLVEDGGETTLRAGDCAAFPKGVADGHHLVNRGIEPCTFVVVGRAGASACHYPDIDLLVTADQRFTHRDGRPY